MATTTTKTQYVTVPESDWEYGIDSRSAENQIDPGYAKDILNADVISKRVRKRTGSQGYAGNIPVRVTSLEYFSTGSLQLTLDSAVSLSDITVDLGAVRSSPLVVYGRSSNVTSGGPFLTTGDTVRYYPGFLIPTRKTFIATSSAPPYETIVVPASETGISTTDMFTSVVESTSAVDKSYQLALPYTTDIDTTSDDITISYQNSTGTDLPVYIFYRDQTPTAGSSYATTVAHAGAGPQSFTIAAGTHGLDNYNILTSVQQDNSGSQQEIQSQVVISNSGTVTVTIDSVIAGNFRIILSSTVPTNSRIGNILGGATSTIQLTGLTSPWVFYGIYQELTPGGDKELVYADTLDYDDSTQTATLTFTNAMSSASNFYVYYTYGVTRSNRIEITDVSVTVDATDPRPQLTIWGLDHAELYGTTPAPRQGWVNHIDSYKSGSDRRMVAGLGGNLFSARTFDEAAGTYLYPLLYPRLEARTSTSLILGPLFWDILDTPARTRGYITSDASGTGWASVTSIAYDSGSGGSLVTLQLPTMAIVDSTGNPTTLSAVLSTTAGLEDYLTLGNMSYSRHNGSWRIMGATSGVDQIVLLVDLTGNSSDYDDPGLQAQGGIFTDQISWLTSSPFVAGDVLLNAALGDPQIYTVLSSLGTVSVIDGAHERLDLAGGILTSGRRVSSLMPLRGPIPSTAPSVMNVVRGDMLVYTGQDYLTGQDQVQRELRVLSVNSDSDRTVDIVGDPTLLTATVTMLSGNTSSLIEGSKVLLLQAGAYSGTQVVETILTATTFTIAMATTTDGDVSGSTLVGNLIEIDEDLEWQDASGDSISVYVDERWIPIEAPDDSYNLTPSTYVRQIDSMPYGNQDFLRSTMVADNLYLTNYTDEVLKYDATSIYRAGLPAWQPGLFLTQDTSVPARIVISNRSVPYTGGTLGSAAGRLTLAGVEDSGVLPVGALIRLSGSTETYTVSSYTDDGTNYYLLLDRSLDTTVTDTGTVSEIATFRYYFRLNAVDANDNIVASAVTGYQDHVVEMTADAAVGIKLVGFPAFDIYDYQRLEVQIYRTQQSLPAPFYLVTTLQMSFDNTLGYITYTDSFSDSDLISLDVVSTALKGQEIGVQWSDPLRAKYVTSIGNRLILANLKDSPQIDMQILADGSVTSSTFAGKTFLLRSDSNLMGTTTNMVDTVIYETVLGVSGTISALTPGTNDFSFTTSSATGAAVGDWIYLTYATVDTTGRDLTYSGHWQISAISGTTVTVRLVGAAAATSYPDSYVVATTTANVPILLGVDGNMGMFNGQSFDLFDLTRRMSMAVNASMRMVDILISGMETFTPWILSRSGNDTGVSGRIVLRRPIAGTVFPAIVLPSTFSGSGVSFQVFVNSIRRSPGGTVSSVEAILSSRILCSYQNYPEIFDNPLSTLDSESDSAVDINPADGQEITGVIPFFGETAFGASLQASVLVVFKTDSIYIVDLSQKAQGNNPVQRLETEGLGCTAPYSITNTKKGIMFANNGGLYCLRRDQTIQYIGMVMERNWQERVDLTQQGIMQGHHYGVGRMYRLSLPLVGQTQNSEMYVYNHTGEDVPVPFGSIAGRGAWSRYDSHNATGWANLDTDAFWGSTQGRVLILRTTGTITDYRDSSDPINFTLDTRAIDAGDTGIRKVLDALVVYYRTIQTDVGTQVLYSVDTSQEYTATTPFILGKSATLTGISDIPGKDIIAILHNIGRRRGIHFQIRVVNNTIDENVEVSGIALRLIGLSERGITQAARTTGGTTG